MRSHAVAALVGISLTLAACGSEDGGGDPVKRIDARSLDVAETEGESEPEAILRVDEVVLRTPDLSTLARAIKTADLAPTLAEDTPITLFAPDNGAFDKLGVDALAELLLPANKERLATVLKYHVIPGRLTAADLRKRIGDSGGSIEIVTLEGEKLNASVELDQIRLSDSSGNVAAIATPDMAANNGMVHGIDQVLGPQF